MNRRLMCFLKVWRDFVKGTKYCLAANFAESGIDRLHGVHGIRCISDETEFKCSGNRIVFKAEAINACVDEGA